MTVRVMTGAAAVNEAPAPVNAAEPRVYTEPENMYRQPVRRFAHSRRKAGFGIIPAVQLIIAAALGAGLWASVKFGDEGTRALCEGLLQLFR